MQSRPWIGHLLFLMLLVAISLVLFQGALDQGMEMDEVSRVINIIPLINSQAEPLNPPLFSLKVGSYRIPIMFKEYISSAYLLRFIPLAFFEDYLFGIRFLHWFYFVLSLGVFYLVMSRFNSYLAVFGTLLVATSPIFYPEVRIGFADPLHILYLSLGAVFLVRFYRHGESKWDLFLGFFLLFFYANQMFYFSWVIAGLLGTGFLLFPRETLKCFYPLSRSLILLGALGLGLLNFVFYNLLYGFPSLFILINKLFRPEAYNAAPIDYRPAQSLSEELNIKLHQLPRYFDAPVFYTAVYGLVGAITVFMLLYFWRRGLLSRNRIYFAPGIVSLIILTLTLISPNTTRVGHYVYLVPFLQLSVLAALLGLGTMLKGFLRLRKGLVMGLPLALLGASFVFSNAVVAKTNRTGGTVLFSPAVFSFVDYLNQESIDSGDVLFTIWGLYAQPYFLTRGDFRIRQVVYDLKARPTEAGRAAYFESLFSSHEALPEQGDSLYLPVFARYDRDTSLELIDFVQTRGGSVVLEKVFPERDGQPAILLYRLDSTWKFVQGQCADIRSARILPSLHISRFGPKPVQAGIAKGLPMWFIASDLTPTTKVALNGLLLRTVYSGDHVTALVPSRALSEPGSVNLFLFDPSRNVRSSAVELQPE